LLALALAAISTQAFAGTETATFQSTATLNASCVVSATNVNFGTITPASGVTNANGEITSTCSKSLPYTIVISGGTSGIANARTMAGTAGNTDKLKYYLSPTASYSSSWGDGTNGTTIVNRTGTGAAQSNTVYGSLPINQYLKPDTYSDNLTVTMTY